MVMFRTKFRPTAAASGEQAQQKQQQRQQAQSRALRTQAQQQQQPQPKVPPIEEERGPQAPIREPEPRHEPERAR
jgi:hypothetical protein